MCGYGSRLWPCLVFLTLKTVLPNNISADVKMEKKLFKPKNLDIQSQALVRWTLGNLRDYFEDALGRWTLGKLRDTSKTGSISCFNILRLVYNLNFPVICASVNYNNDWLTVFLEWMSPPCDKATVIRVKGLKIMSWFCNEWKLMNCKREVVRTHK